MRKIRFEIAALLAMLAASPAAAGALSVSHATFRMISPAVPAAAYFELVNLEETAVVLTGARSPACGAMMMHQSSTEGGMAQMREVHAVTLAPRQTVRFAPGGYHLMCMDPSASLMTARTVPVRLEFEHYPPVEATFTVTDALGRPH